MPIGYIFKPEHKTKAPTRRCLVCERKEHPDSIIVDTSAAWLCDNCRTALVALVYLEDKIKENIT